MNKEKTGKMIRQARIDKGYTQSELGDMIGVSNKAISRWENGETFPDIGVIEPLAQMLELRIQDIITGTKDSDQDTAITEVVRVAKMQGKEKMRKLVENGVAIVMLCYLLIKGGLAFRGNVVDSMTYVELAIVLILLATKYIMDHRTEAAKFDRFGKWMVAISIISGVYMIAGMFINTMMISRGQMPFHMQPSSVGWYLEGRLIVVFVINLVILVVDFVRRTRCAAPMVHMGTYPAVANIYLTYVYSDMLHRLDDMAGFLNRLAAGTLIVLCEVFVAVIVDICIEKLVLKGKNNSH
uniref:helix-turn-helix domain-containing protein n=1 Tax=Agathobacter sp. TaxID=2021311 RepID=UPI003FF0D71C